TTTTTSSSTEVEQRVWCCAWGQIKREHNEPPDNNNSNSNGGSCSSGGGGSSSCSSSSKSNCLEDAAELAIAPVNHKPKEFVVTGGFEPQLKIVHISPSEMNVFPHEYSHQLPGMGVHNVAVSPDSSCIAAVAVDGNLTLLDVQDGVRLPSVGHSLVSNVWSTAFAAGSNDYVYAGSGSGHVFLYETSMGKLQHSYDTLRCENVLGLAISRDQRLLGCCDYAGNFCLLDGVTGQLLRRRNYKSPMRKLIFDPSVSESQAFAACDDKTIKIIDLPSGRFRESLMGHDAYVMSVSASADGRRLVSGACDGSIKVWDLRSTKSAMAFVCLSNSNLWDVAFNRVGNKISFVGDGKGLNIYYCLGNREMMLV
ncbi:hypothetical protein KR222_009434, partial [Zaprionus bogoriensis]